MPAKRISVETVLQRRSKPHKIFHSVCRQVNFSGHAKSGLVIAGIITGKVWRKDTPGAQDRTCARFVYTRALRATTFGASKRLGFRAAKQTDVHRSWAPRMRGFESLMPADVRFSIRRKIRFHRSVLLSAFERAVISALEAKHRRAEVSFERLLHAEAV